MERLSQAPEVSWSDCGVRLIISDACMGGLVESAAEFYPEAQWQRCTVHFYRNVFTVVPSKHLRPVADMLKAIHAAEDREAAQDKANAVIEKLRTHAAEGGGTAGAGWHYGDTDLLPFSRLPLAAHPNEQSTGAEYP